LEGEQARTPMELACIAQNIELFKLLHSRGARIERRFFFSAAEKLQTEVAHALAALGLCDPDWRSLAAGKTALMAVCSARDHKKAAEVCELLIDRGELDVNLEGDQGKTPMELACTAQNIELIRLLAARGARVEGRLFYSAAEKLQTGVVRALGALGGCDPDWRSPATGRTALMQVCCTRGRLLDFVVETTLALLEAGASTNLEVPRGFPYPSLDEAVLEVFSQGHFGMITGIHGAIPPNRRALHWFLNTPVPAFSRFMAEYWKHARLPAGATEAQVREAKANRLKRLREDAWKRRRHLCLDRALWRKPAPAEVKGEKGSSEAGEVEGLKTAQAPEKKSEKEAEATEDGSTV
jgi:ankyrin repeat protein